MSAAPKPSAEQLAMLLDNRLDPAERARILAQLENDPEAREILADAAAALGELNTATESGRNVQPTKPALRVEPRLRRELLLAIAAVLIIAIVLPLTRVGRTPANLPPVQTIALGLESSSPGMTVSHPWREFRGAAEPISARARAVRVGALLADLELATTGHDTAATVIAAQAAALLSAYPGGGIVADRYRVLAQSPALGDVAARNRAANLAEVLAGEREVRLGGWLEAARVAAAGHDSAFFDRPTTATAIRVATSVARTESGASLDVTVLSAALAQPRDWIKLARAVDAALVALAD